MAPEFGCYGEPVRAIRRFLVEPVLPDPLKDLAALALNLRWSWNSEASALFQTIDPDLWESCEHDPRRLLAQVSTNRLQVLAGDKRYLRHLENAVQDLEEYLTGDHWYQSYAQSEPAAPRCIGYFSAEFGISSVLPQYSGGLGILAGDHLKSASDLGAPLIGVGLLYQHGYFRQSLDARGWQQERYPVLDPNELPLTRLTEKGRPVVLEVAIRHRRVKFQIWIAQVGRVPLLMLDTNLEENGEAERTITDRLYGGGSEHRLAQEVLLGVGGVRALRTFCRISGRPDPDVYHCNEGHAGFLGLERIREFMESGDDFATAVVKTRAGSVFTTHTPVAAGIDRFRNDLIADEFADFGPLPIERILELGREDFAGGDPSRFNMAVMGLRLGQHANGVSQLHGQVSREMFNGLWPDFDASEVPITSVTNGVHHPTWIHPELLEVLEARTGDSDSIIDGYDWKALDRIDDNALWALKGRMRGDMVTMARARLARSYQARGISADWVHRALNPHTLTIGFARRGASYKRLTLMLTQPARLKALLNHPITPIQIVIAGKAHPADDIGKGLIQQMVQFADREDVRGKLVFLPDYDISLAKPLYPGCDVWLNNPLRPYEACGTSGMKAALNGAANLSIRDGWWDEWYDSAFGWEIPSAEGVSDNAQRDRVEAETLYEIIEKEIIPRFYERDQNGLPNRWLTMVRQTISGLGPKVLASRMVRDYITQLYTPAASLSTRIHKGGTAERLAGWQNRVRRAWPQVRIARVEALHQGPVSVGADVHFAAWVELNGLGVDDVDVQLVAGDVTSSSDEMSQVRTYQLVATGEREGNTLRFATAIRKDQAGSVGYTVRVVPRNDLLIGPAEMGLAVLPQS